MQIKESLSTQRNSNMEKPPYLDMYEFKDQNGTEIYQYQRYLKDKEKEAPEILKQVAFSMNTFKRKVLRAEKDERVIILTNALESGNIYLEERCAEILAGYKNNILNQKEESVVIKFKEIIKRGLNSLDPKEQKRYAEMIKSLPSKYAKELILYGFSTNNIEIQKICSRFITSSNPDEVVYLRDHLGNLLQKYIATKDLDTISQTIEMVNYISHRDKLFIKTQIDSIVMKGIETSDPSTQKKYFELIPYCTPETLLYSIKRGLEVDNIEIQKLCAEILAETYNELIEKERSKLRKKIIKIIKIGLNSDQENIQRCATEMLWSIPVNPQLFALAQEKCGTILVESMLYKNIDVSSERFQRLEFPKSGSRSTLLAGSLKDKIIIRHIEPESFLVWQKAYENYKIWQEARFDYVPIEPIHSFKLSKSGLVDVYSGVLDLNLARWCQITDKFSQELNIEKDRIIRTLDRNSIHHGHPHDSNFCLRFFRNKKGQVDFTKKPRLYLIDFDQAI